jgi:hypothetical protein
MDILMDKLTFWLQEIPWRVKQSDEAEWSTRPAPGRWSKKEILGHLCDSALNNIQRFMRIQYEEPPVRVLKYDQDKWVELQHYQNLSAKEVCEIWVSLNNMIYRIVSSASLESLNNTFDNGQTFLWFIEDYIKHLEHHCTQIFLEGNLDAD